MGYIIATSSTSDLTRPYLEEHHIPFISYSYTMDNKPCTDDCREESRQEVYDKMRAGALLKTTMINEVLYYEFLKPLLEAGNDVIFLDMSEKMSASFQNCRRACDTLSEEFPERKLYFMDTRCISGGLGYLVKQMVSRMEAGMGWDELIAWGEENKLRISHRFTVDDLNYLKAGGRVSNASALVGSLLSIKPVLYVPDIGTLEVAQKIRGRKHALDAIVDGVKKDLAEAGASGVPVDILQADCRADAQYVADGIRAAYPEIGEITITNLGVVIGAHCGPGLLAVFYFGGKRQP